MDDLAFAHFLEKSVARSGKSLGSVAADLRGRGFKINRSTLLRWTKGDTLPSRKKLPLLHCLPDVLDMPPAEQAAFGRVVSWLTGAYFTASPPRARPPAYFLGGQMTYFTGRKRELARLGAAVSQRQSVFITGLGGVGKTSLARKLLEEYAGQFPRGCDAIRILPRQPASVVAGLVARRLGLPLPPEQEGADVQLIISRLQEHFGRLDMLFLLDNVDVSGQTRPLLAGLPNITWLLTSRRELFLPAPDVVRLRLDPPDNNAAADMVIHYAGTPPTAANRQAARQIAGRLGRLPIALRAAAGLVAAKRLPDLPRLKRWLCQRGLDALAVDDWEMTRFLDEALEQLYAPAACDLLTLCGLFAAPVIRREAFTAIAGKMGWPADALSDLVNFSLAQEEDDETFSLHPLIYEYAVQRVRQDGRYRRMQLQFTRYYADYAVRLRDNVTALSIDFANMSLAAEYAFALQEWYLVGRLWGPVSGQMWRLSQWPAYLAINEKTLQAARMTGDRRMQAKTLTAIGWIHFEEKRYKQAEVIFLQAKELCETLQSAKQLVYLYRYLGILHTEAGNLTEAERWLQEAEVRVWHYMGRTGRGADWISLSLSMICHARADVAQMSAEYHLAQMWSEKALAISLASPHPYDASLIPMIRLRLGDIFCRQNALEQAARQWRSAMVFDAQYPPEQRIIAGSMLRLSQIDMTCGRRQDALNWADKARQIYWQSGLASLVRKTETMIVRMESASKNNLTEWEKFELWD